MCRDARVKGGRLSSWGGKYKALVDGQLEDVVVGRSVLVRNAEEEDGLRFFETEAYEIVRCRIELTGDDHRDGDRGREEVIGLCFRFCREGSC